MRSTTRRRARLSSALLLSFTLVAAACGSDDESSSSTAAPTTTAAAADTTAAVVETTAAATETSAAATDTTTVETETTPAATETTADDGAEADAKLAELVAAAEEEGSVTIYSSQGLDQLNALAEAFKATYPGIEVEVVRQVDGDTIPRLETELSTNTAGADLAVLAAYAWVTDQATKGSFVDATASPQLSGLDAYDAAQYYHEGDFFEVGAAVLTFAWNTEHVPEGITDYPDLLNPDFADGKLGVVDPSIGAAVVDFWRWVEENFGEDYVTQLADLHPSIYPGALPIGEALTSGEIYASVYAAPVQLVPAAANGAPVDYGISDKGAWGARYYGVIPKSAAHPNAAALFADFMVTAQGQELVQGTSGSVLPDIPGTLITNDKVRIQDLAGMQPEPVAEYIAKWDALFR